MKNNKWIIVGISFLLWSCQAKNVKSDQAVDVNSTQVESSLIKNETQMVKIPEYINRGFVTGDFEPKEHPKFALIEAKYSDREDRYMHVDAYDSFKKMHSKAAAEGVHLTILSATRNFNYQKNIWHRKWRGLTLLEGKINAKTDIQSDEARAKAIMRYSSMPGTSRHHWGTDIDINSFDNTYFEKGQGKTEYDWLTINGPKFGFYQVYTDKKAHGRTGYELERWHWSYIPIAKMCLAVAEAELENSDIKGFEGAEQAPTLDVKKNYIFGVDKSCF